MSTRKLRPCLPFAALASCFVRPAFAAAEEEEGSCTVCVYSDNPKHPYDPSKGACFDYPQCGTFD